MKISIFRFLKKHTLLYILVYCALASIFITAFILLAYKSNWTWTGFSNKTLWDWMQLLIIPLVLAIGGLLLNLTINRNEQTIAEKRYAQDRKTAEDQQNEDLLQSYLDKMTELITNNNLYTAQPNSYIRQIARARTITVLSKIDGLRKSSILQFLSETDLIKLNNYESILNLENADLSWANLDFHLNLSNVNLRKVYFYAAEAESVNFSGADLREAILEEIDLAESNLQDANLSNATLSDATLWEADLQRANLCKAKLYNTDFSGANLTNANLSEASLTRANFSSRGNDTFPADLSGANLTNADLSGANLSGANLTNADLSGANLTNADLSGANLSGANLTNANLSDAKGAKQHS